MPYIPHDQQQTAQARAALAAQAKPRTKNKLAPQKEENPPQKPEPCKHPKRILNGISYNGCKPDCELGGSMKFNPAFTQNHHLTGGAVKRRNRRGATE